MPLNFGALVKKVRKEKKITAEDLAKKVGVDRTYISKIENHSHLPSLEICLRIASILGIEIKVQEPTDTTDMISKTLPPISLQKSKKNTKRDLLSWLIEEKPVGSIKDKIHDAFFRVRINKDKKLIEAGVKDILSAFAPNYQSDKNLIKNITSLLEDVNRLDKEIKRIEKKQNTKIDSAITKILKPKKSSNK